MSKAFHVYDTVGDPRIEYSGDVILRGTSDVGTANKVVLDDISMHIVPWSKVAQGHGMSDVKTYDCIKVVKVVLKP